MKEPGHGTHEYKYHVNKWTNIFNANPNIKSALGKKFQVYIEAMAILFGVIIPDVRNNSCSMHVQGDFFLF
jgi:hypothetical protein